VHLRQAAASGSRRGPFFLAQDEKAEQVDARSGNILRMDESLRRLAAVASGYAVPLRMGEGLSLEAERFLYDELCAVRQRLGESRSIDRELASLLTEIVQATWPTTGQYRGEELERICESVATGEAVMAVLTPSEMPPLPRDRS
jgi:hypothetical protein